MNEIIDYYDMNGNKLDEIPKLGEFIEHKYIRRDLDFSIRTATGIWRFCSHNIPSGSNLYIFNKGKIESIKQPYCLKLEHVSFGRDVDNKINETE